MAQKVQVVLECDVCEGGKPGSETIGFGLEGQSYEIDLCDRHAKQLRDSVSTFVGAGRRATSGGRGRSGSRSGSRSGRSSGGADRERTQAIRAWARKKGIAVSERGRLSGDIVAQYEAANGK